MNNNLPRIGILADQNKGLHSDRDTVTQTYSKSIHQAGGIPIIIPNIRELLYEYLSLIDGLLLRGSDLDIDPIVYKQKNIAVKNCIKTKDLLDIKYVNKCVKNKIPVLGICRGIQIINIALGGTLIQHLETNISHHNTSKTLFKHIHEVQINNSNYFLTQRIKVNSTHHQAIDKLGKDLKITGLSEDQVTEMIEFEDKNYFLVGVQWHPECLSKKGTFSKQLFKEFIAATKN